jgi:hypothetical protein
MGIAQRAPYLARDAPEGVFMTKSASLISSLPAATHVAPAQTRSRREKSLGWLLAAAQAPMDL